jgi:hypothetical protein
MTHGIGSRAFMATAVTLAGLLAPGVGAAQTSPGEWRISASIYAYLPSIGGQTAFPIDSGSSLDVSADQIVDSLNFTFMGTLGAHNGRWGMFTDVLYLDIGGDKQGTRDFSVGNRQIPASTTADLDWDLKGLIWTLAGEYRVASQPGYTVDLLVGARMFDMKQDLGWTFTGDIGSLPPRARSGSARVEETLWDGIVGVKGRINFGDSGKWSAPFYLDVGTGDSDSTWQVLAGVSYAFGWGELTGVWRYLAYELKNSAVTDINFNGPMIGATWRW